MKKISVQNVTIFLSEYFSENSKYYYLRLGQAFMNTFMPEIIITDLQGDDYFLCGELYYSEDNKEIINIIYNHFTEY